MKQALRRDLPPRARSFYEARARLMKALAHPTRLLILDALRESDRCVCELVRIVGADQSTVSKHLAILKNAGMASDAKRGAMRVYRLRVKCLEVFFRCMESILEGEIEERRGELAGS